MARDDGSETNRGDTRCVIDRTSCTDSSARPTEPLNALYEGPSPFITIFCLP